MLAANLAARAIRVAAPIDINRVASTDSCTTYFVAKGPATF